MKLHIYLIFIAFLVNLFAEKVSFKEIENVAINYYRQNVARLQFVKGIIPDYEKAVNPKNISYGIDSLVIEDLTVSYFFNFEPTGYIQVDVTDALEPCRKWNESGSININELRSLLGDPSKHKPVSFHKNNLSYKKYYDKPTAETLTNWIRYKVDPAEFEIEIPYKAERVSLNDATNVAINYYRDRVVPIQVKRGYIPDYESAINLDSIKFTVDSLVSDSFTYTYCFNFLPTGMIKVKTYTNLPPVGQWAERGKFNMQRVIELKGLRDSERYYDKLEIQVLDAQERMYYLYRDKIPTIKAIEDWNKYKVAPEEYQIQKIEKEDDADVAPDGGILDSNDKKE